MVFGETKTVVAFLKDYFGFHHDQLPLVAIVLIVFTKLPGVKSSQTKISIINDVSGIIKPGRITLLLGPPGCGKTTLLKALSGNLNQSLKITGEISYNGYKLEEFVSQKTSSYISQNDLHIHDMTVREILDFSARCQGVGSRAEVMVEVSEREKEAGVVPDPDIDTYMKAISVKGLKGTLQTDYILKILALDIGADTLVGNAMRRGISGGQKKRLTTELAMTLQRLDVFYKQKEFCFYPAWAYAIPASVLKVPLSFVESLVWTSLTYYVIGYSPEAKRFFCQFILLFAVHLSSVSMCRFVASVFQTQTSAMTAGTLAVFLQSVFGGFIITQPSMPVWLKWGFWVSPLTYGEIGLSLNEFLAPRWQKMLSTNATIGQEILKSRGLYFDGYLYWISLGALFGFTIVFNIGYILALSFLKSPGSCRAIISHEKLSEIRGTEDSHDGNHRDKKSRNSPPLTSIEPKKGRMVLLFTPLKVAFQDVQYYVDTPLITVEESAIFSAWLRLSPQIDAKTKAEFVNEVLETIELDGIKDALVGIPGVTGLSNEQRKRLTIAVELVANPSIIFIDEPTTGLDVRAAAIVMQAVKNAADTGRTIVCTIHQPSIDIFEAFDELILLKTGGHLIYSGQLGEHSSSVIEYFESILGVPKIRNNYNPAAWMLDVTSTSAEAKLGIDFALKYRESALYE
ncbi:hypothetical protein CMV_013749 [Castanea mollissima]|uniref:ABC transporter domain-containing protein n=1 Tax=Castanea mollissima TaxID=60419 RepID=A0A8J4VLK9_9ROSI|nr:hypothetical protein CMV_013749 [Castanea mollissima]